MGGPREDYGEAPSGLDDFPGWQFDTAVLLLIYGAALAVGILVDRGLLH